MPDTFLCFKGKIRPDRIVFLQHKQPPPHLHFLPILLYNKRLFSYRSDMPVFFFYFFQKNEIYVLTNALCLEYYTLVCFR